MYKFILISALSLMSATAIAEPYAKLSLGWAYLPKNQITINSGRDTSTITSKGNGSFITGALGAGASLANNFRSDLEIYLDDGIKSQRQYKNSILNFKIKTLAGFANITYDIPNSTKYTPFVMAGIGYARNKTSITSCTKLYHRTNSNLAYQAGFGVGYNINKDVALEVSYRFIDKGVRNQKMLNDGNTTIMNHKSSGRLHTFLVGTRINL